mgnify:CR=1 FL=1
MKNITLNIIGQRILADVLKEKEAIIKINILFFHFSQTSKQHTFLLKKQGVSNYSHNKDYFSYNSHSIFLIMETQPHKIF